MACYLNSWCLKVPSDSGALEIWCCSKHGRSMTTNVLDDRVAFLQPDETAAQMIARCKVVTLPTSVEFLDRHSMLRARNVALLTGSSGTAKSRILMQIAANCILPRQSQGYEIGGLEGSCIFIDVDLKFDIAALVSVFNARLRIAFADLTEEQFQRANQELLNESIERFHLVRCANGGEMLALLKAMPTLMAEGGPPKFLLIDGCATVGNVSAPEDGSSREAGLTAAQVSIIAAHHIGPILACRVAVVATQNRASFSGDSDPENMHKQLIPPGWQDIITHHIRVSKLQGAQEGQGPQRWAATWLLPRCAEQESFMIDRCQISSSTSK